MHGDAAVWSRSKLKICSELRSVTEIKDQINCTFVWFHYFWHGFVILQAILVKKKTLYFLVLHVLVSQQTKQPWISTDLNVCMVMQLFLFKFLSSKNKENSRLVLFMSSCFIQMEVRWCSRIIIWTVYRDVCNFLSFST